MTAPVLNDQCDDTVGCVCDLCEAVRVATEQSIVQWLRGLDTHSPIPGAIALGIARKDHRRICDDCGRLDPDLRPHPHRGTHPHGIDALRCETCGEGE